ncbi:hypothetical protein OK016_22195 [Vibrio chagasii]|nr:hypothetical protein [Vibrio chagasii]
MVGCLDTPRHPAAGRTYTGTSSTVSNSAIRARQLVSQIHLQSRLLVAEGPSTIAVVCYFSRHLHRAVIMRETTRSAVSMSPNKFIRRRASKVNAPSSSCGHHGADIEWSVLTGITSTTEPPAYFFSVFSDN